MKSHWTSTFSLHAPELSNLQRKFEETYCTDKRTQNHELTGGKLSRVTQNAVKLSAVFYRHGNMFESADEDEIYNLLTKSVMNETVTNDILHCDEIGQQMFEDFVTERLREEKLSVWEKMTKRKLGTYKSANASTEIRVGDNVVSRFVTSSVALLPVSLTLTASPNWPPTLIDDVISRATSGL